MPLRRQQSQLKSAGLIEKTPEQRAADRKKAEANMCAYACAVCKQTFANTAKSFMLTEHMTNKHPKETDVKKLFPTFTKWDDASGSAAAAVCAPVKKASKADDASKGGDGAGKKAKAKEAAALAAAALAAAAGKSSKKKPADSKGAGEGDAVATGATEPNHEGAADASACSEAECSSDTPPATDSAPADATETETEMDVSAGDVPAPARVETAEDIACRERWAAEYKTKAATRAEAAAVEAAREEVETQSKTLRAAMSKGGLPISDLQLQTLMGAAGMA